MGGWGKRNLTDRDRTRQVLKLPILRRDREVQWTGADIDTFDGLDTAVVGFDK